MAQNKFRECFLGTEQSSDPYHHYHTPMFANIEGRNGDRRIPHLKKLNEAGGESLTDSKKVRLLSYSY